MRVGSLCTGYGGLDLALGGETMWVSEIDKHAAIVTAARFPNVPNLGDLTAVDWDKVPPVDALIAGYPCQPFSIAGKRRGITDARHIWPSIADAVRVLRPRICLFENVAGHVSAGFDGVLADLAACGFDAEWATVRASDVGAPHRRERLFVYATSTGRQGDAQDRIQRGELVQRHCRTAANAEGDGRHKGGSESARVEGGPYVAVDLAPAANADGRGLEVGTQQDLDPANTVTSAFGYDTDGLDWGHYTPAIRRWETILGRCAPAPTEPNRSGKPCLSPRFVEWMMGLPSGWVTDLNIARSAQLKILGNGVVPQQAALALDVLTRRRAAAVA